MTVMGSDESNQLRVNGKEDSIQECGADGDLDWLTA